MMWCFLLDISDIAAMLNMMLWFKANHISNNAEVSGYLVVVNYVRLDGESTWTLHGNRITCYRCSI